MHAALSVHVRSELAGKLCICKDMIQVCRYVDDLPDGMHKSAMRMTDAPVALRKVMLCPSD